MAGLLLAKPSKAARLRAKKKAIAKEAYERRSVFGLVDKRDGYRCRACRAWASPNSPDELKRGHHHHIQYRSHGGADSTANMCLLCPICHADCHEGRLTIRGNADAQLTIVRRGSN